MRNNKRMSACVNGRPHDLVWILLPAYRGFVTSESEYLEQNPWHEGDPPASFMKVCKNKGCPKTFGVATAMHLPELAKKLTREMVARVALKNGRPR